LLPETLRWLATLAPESNASAVKALEQKMPYREAHHRAAIQKLEPLLAGGDPNRGHELFLAKATCATCHRVGQHGGLVGPDLTKIGSIRSGRALLESLVAPSATFAQSDEPYGVTLKEGETVSGGRGPPADDAFA